MSHETLRRKLEQRHREQQYYTVPDQCRDYGEPHPVQKPMPMSERIFCGVVFVISVAIGVFCYVRSI